MGLSLRSRPPTQAPYRARVREKRAASSIGRGRVPGPKFDVQQRGWGYLSYRARVRAETLAPQPRKAGLASAPTTIFTVPSSRDDVALDAGVAEHDHGVPGSVRADADASSRSRGCRLLPGSRTPAAARDEFDDIRSRDDPDQATPVEDR